MYVPGSETAVYLHTDEPIGQVERKGGAAQAQFSARNTLVPGLMYSNKFGTMPGVLIPSHVISRPSQVYLPSRRLAPPSAW